MRWTHEVTIQRKTRTPDGIGGWVTNWVTVTATVARVSPISAKDRLQYDQLQYPVTHKVYLPGTADVKPEDRIVLGNRMLVVKGIVNPAEIGHHLETLCEELTSPAS
ncbi:MAG: phage head closure protein [Bacillota bacterium]